MKKPDDGRLRPKHVKYTRHIEIYKHCEDGKSGSACCQLHVDFLFGLLFGPEDGGNMFLRNFHRTTQLCIPEVKNLHGHRCENLKPTIFEVYTF
jgi:hypothetical protein